MTQRECFSTEVLLSLQSAVDNLFNRRISALHSNITNEDFLAAIVPEAHMQIIKSAYGLLREPRSNNIMRIKCGSHPDLLDGITVELTHGWPAPRFPIFDWAGPHADEVLRKIVVWRDSRKVIGTEFAGMKPLLRYLRKQCTTVEQLRYLWPGIAMLAQVCSDGEEHMKTFKSRVSVFTAVKTFPSLPPEAKNVMKSASAMLTGTLLLPEVVPQNYGHIKLDIQNNQYVTSALFGQYPGM